MKKSLLSTAIAGALLATSSVATAQVFATAPNLSVPEKAAFTCIEQALSVTAAIVERTGCAAVANPGVYSLGGNVNFDGDGSCTLDDFTITVDTILDDFRGTNVLTANNGRGQVDDVVVDNKTGAYWFSRLGEIMYGSSDFTLCVADCNNPSKDEDYDEHIIKDFYDIASVSRIIIDEGLEVITKEDYPRMKFRQDSTYVPPNGGIGDLIITKVPIAPENSPVCTILYDAVVDDLSGGIQFSGNVTVL